MKLIAVNTIHVRKVTRQPDPNKAKDRGRSTKVLIEPGREFDTAELGIDEDEANVLIDSGAARRKMREVTEADEAPGRAAGDGKLSNAPTA